MTTEKTLPRVIRFDDLLFQPRQEKPEMAQLAEIVGEEDGTPLGAGYARLNQARIEWTVLYDEVVTVVEGSMRIHTPQGILEAGPRDCVWLPAGTPLIYEAESALIHYCLHPSNWASARTTV
ncbi:ethanolamine utilization protein EutQ [Alcaligenes phenolicus]